MQSIKIRCFLSLFTIVFLFSCTHSVKSESAEDEKRADVDSCCIKNKTVVESQVAESEITCPKCGYKKMEVMPTDACVIKYTCEKCKVILYPKEGDCCVFCTYGTHKCPSKQ